MRTRGVAPDPLTALWSLAFAISADALDFWLGLHARHRLGGDEREDKAHHQLVVPESLRGDDEGDLFA